MKHSIKNLRVYSATKSKGGIVSKIDNMLENEFVYLSADEYDSIKYKDYLKLSQLKASEKMGISRPTLTLIYDKARYKIAKSLCENKKIITE
ncbi:MAG: DUF134 domain-containing protein [Ichthyobacteriaceae bacterium]|nr:DUF134 domain-containing protein [Ichthyobacteriaceae bacterium]